MSQTTRGLVVATFLLTLLSPARATAQADEPTTKSPQTAVLLSFLGTLTPAAISRPWGVFAGLVLGPNLGDLYGGEPRRWAVQTAVRAGVVGVTAGTVLALCSDGCFGLSDNSADAPAGILIIAGTAATVFLAGREVVGVGKRVQDRNERVRARVSVNPTVYPGGRGIGVAVRIGF